MREQLYLLKEVALKELEAVKDLSELQNWRVKYLGRRSELTAILRTLASKS
jgi:phenylalanyl-tRNA synthetase alpha chain